MNRECSSRRGGVEVSWIRQNVSRRARHLVSMASCVVLLGSLGAPTAWAANSVAENSQTFGSASLALGGDVTVWRPRFSAGLSQKGPIDVIAFGKGKNRATFVGVTYGKRVPSFTLAQKGARTEWAATPVERDTAGFVELVTIRMGPPGNKVESRARVYANCQVSDSVGSNDQPGQRRCSRADVARFGGALEVVARTTRGGRMAVTNIRIDSVGLSFSQLVKIAEQMTPVVN